MSCKLKHVITKEEEEKEGEEEVIVHGIYKPLGRSTRRVRPDLPPAFCVLLLWASPSLTELWSHQPLLSPRKPANTKGNTLDEASGKKRAGRDGNPWLPSLRLRGEPCLSPGLWVSFSVMSCPFSSLYLPFHQPPSHRPCFTDGALVSKELPCYLYCSSPRKVTAPYRNSNSTSGFRRSYERKVTFDILLRVHIFENLGNLIFMQFSMKLLFV